MRCLNRSMSLQRDMNTYGLLKRQTRELPGAAASLPRKGGRSRTMPARRLRVYASNLGVPRSRFDVQVELVRALIKQAQKTTLPLVTDLVRPWLSPAPKPLADTLPPEELADPDSKFITVDGVELHYKDVTYWPSPTNRLPGFTAGTNGNGSSGIHNSSSSSTSPSNSSSRHWEVNGVASNGNGIPNGASNGSRRGTVYGEDQQQQQEGQPGAEEPLTLLFIHGFNGWLFSWRDVMPGIGQAMADAGVPCRLIAFDRPPFGLSSRPLHWEREEDNPYTNAAGARFAEGLMKSLGVSKCVVVGHSAGATVAVDLSLRCPDLVSGLVLVAPALSTTPRNLLADADLGQVLRFAATRALLASDGPGLNYVRSMINKRKEEVLQGQGVLEKGQLNDAATGGYLLPLKAHDWDRACLAMYRSFGSSWSVPDYDQLKMPVLVVQGDLDKAVPQSMAVQLVERLAARSGSTSSPSSSSGSSSTPPTSPNSSEGPVTEYVEFQGCGHIPMDEMPEDFNAAVTQFLLCRMTPAEEGQEAAGRSGTADRGAEQEQLQQSGQVWLQQVEEPVDLEGVGPPPQGLWVRAGKGLPKHE